MMRVVVAVMFVSACGVEDVGVEDIGIPGVASQTHCDLIIELGRQPYTPVEQIQQIHDVSDHCFDADAMDAFTQAWVTDVCTPRVYAFGPPGGGCYGSCDSDKSNPCLTGD